MTNRGASPRVLKYLTELRQRAGVDMTSVLAQDAFQEWSRSILAGFTEEEIGFVRWHATTIAQDFDAAGAKFACPDPDSEEGARYEAVREDIEMTSAASEYFEHGEDLETGLSRMPREFRERFEGWLARRDDRRAAERLILEASGKS